MPQTPAFLIVEDDEAIARSLVRLFARHRPTMLAPNTAAARKELGASAARWIGLVLDIGLPDGSGLDVLSFARQRWPLLPALVLTGQVVPDVINKSFSMRAEFLCKPGSREAFLAFIQRAIAREGVAEPRVIALIEELSIEKDLTPREVQLLTLLMADVRRAAFPGELGITENTAKSQIRSLLKKCRANSLDELARMMLKRALSGGQAPRPNP